MLTWKRERVRNFGEAWADAYIATLVHLDGQPYDQPRFFQELAKTGIVSDVEDQGSPQATDALRFKRWDAYSNRIREYGLGFWEQRFGGPKIWRVSELARSYDSGSMSYREFMALQLMRTQVPVPVMPLGALESQVAKGIHIRPLAITLQALRELGEQSEPTYLSEEEFSQLQRVESDADLPAVLNDIVGSRSGQKPNDWLDTIASIDIWFNELRWTGYLRRVVADGSGLPGHVLVPRWARQDEASALGMAIPVQTYTDLVSVNRFHDFFCSVPEDAALATVRTPPSVVLVDVPADGSWDAQTRVLTGPFDRVGGLAPGDELVLRGSAVGSKDRSTLFKVVDDVERTGSIDVDLPLEAARKNMHGQPIQV